MINHIRLLSYNENTGIAQVCVSCSRGTYVRALARDIAQKLNTIGFASTIRRVGIGPVHIDNALKVSSIYSTDQVIPIYAFLNYYPSAIISQDAALKMIQGLPIILPAFDHTGVVFLYDESKEFIASAEHIAPCTYKPKRVLTYLHENNKRYF